jgi:hypothetical protein
MSRSILPFVILNVAMTETPIPKQSRRQFLTPRPRFTVKAVRRSAERLHRGTLDWCATPHQSWHQRTRAPRLREHHLPLQNKEESRV